MWRCKRPERRGAVGSPWSFEELAFNGAALEVECEFRSHEEAIQMCEQLRRQGVLLDSPQLHKLDDTRVGARLRGRMTPATKLAGGQ